MRMASRRRWMAILAPLIWLAVPPARGASLLEDTLQIAVHADATGGPALHQSILVRVVRPSEAGPALPYLVLLHGRAADPALRARLALPIYPANARYFAGLGFAVLIPLRAGYGASGGPDVEQTGSCELKRYAEGVAPAAAETRQVLEFARSLPYVDPARGLIVGESFGGLAAIALAAHPPRGLRGVVNVAGGDGGDSLHRPDEPCRPDQLRAAFARYGRTARIPTLWLYSANDRFWGTVYPRQWYEAFRGAGGVGTFVTLPADKNNGHFIFNRNAPAWHPAFERFLDGLGLGRDAGRADSGVQGPGRFADGERRLR